MLNFQKEKRKFQFPKKALEGKINPKRHFTSLENPISHKAL